MVSEIINKKKNGELFNSICHINPLLDEKGKLSAFIGFEVNITPLIQAKEHAAELALFPEQNPSPVWRIDRNKKILYSNLPAKAFIELPAPLMSAILTTFKTKSTRTIEWTFGRRTHQFRAIYVKKKDYVNVYGMDITKIKQAESSLIKSRQAVEKVVMKRTEELKSKIAELELFRESVVSAELDLKEVEEENERLKEELANINTKRKSYSIGV